MTTISPRGCLDDGPATIIAAARSIASDAHTVLTQATSGAPRAPREDLDHLLGRIDDLLDCLGENRRQKRLDEGRRHTLRFCLNDLRRQILSVQERGELHGPAHRLEERA